MRFAPIAFALVIAGAVTAADAKPAPTAEIARPDFESTPAAWSIYLGPAGAMLESDYFNAPQGPFRAGRIVPCRLDTGHRDTPLKLAYACRGY